MIDLDALNTKLRAVIREGLGMPANSVRPANQNAPTVPPPFATVLLDTAAREGWDRRTYANVVGSNPPTVTETVEGTRHLIASVQFFGAGAQTLGARLGAVLQTSASLAALKQAGLGLIKVGQSRDLSKVVNTIWEGRAQLEIELYAISSETSVLPTIGTIPTNVVLD